MTRQLVTGDRRLETGDWVLDTGKSADYFLTLLLMHSYKGDTKELPQDETVVDTLTEDPCQLVVWNDEVNTFEWVIATLMEVCGHSHEQAEQCAYIIHFHGKYAVANGSFDDLKPKCEAIIDRGINATVEVTV